MFICYILEPKNKKLTLYRKTFQAYIQCHDPFNLCFDERPFQGLQLTLNGLITEITLQTSHRFAAKNAVDFQP